MEVALGFFFMLLACDMVIAGILNASTIERLKFFIWIACAEGMFIFGCYMFSLVDL